LGFRQWTQKRVTAKSQVAIPPNRESEHPSNVASQNLANAPWL
jgi:hypothetical protein